MCAFGCELEGREVEEKKMEVQNLEGFVCSIPGARGVISSIGLYYGQYLE